MACPNKLLADILNDCSTDIPKAGLSRNSKAVIINFADIDRSSTTTSENVITDLILKAGKTGYTFGYDGIKFSISSEYALDEENISGFTHTGSGRFKIASSENEKRIKELSKGHFVIVVSTPLDADSKYKVIGFENGLILTSNTYNVNENTASVVFSLATPDNAKESYSSMTFFETDLATSTTAFDSNFASA